MSKILIAGGTGLVGNALTKYLLDRGHDVALLSRTPDKVKNLPAFYWNPMKVEIDSDCMKDVDFVINLAGAGIADTRWTTSRKKLIIESRTKGAELLGKLFSKGDRPKKYIAASAIGFYGDRGEEKLNEDSAPGDGFLSESVIAWEAASKSVESCGVPVNIVRIGIVLSTKGGALAKMLPTYSLKFGSYFGDGSQIYSWIHIDDVVNVFSFLIEAEEKKGLVINAVAPHPVSNKEMAHSINTAGDYGAMVIPAPAFAMKLALGEMSAVVLDSTNVQNNRLSSLGFEFQWPTIDKALSDIISNGK